MKIRTFLKESVCATGLFLTGGFDACEKQKYTLAKAACVKYGFEEYREDFLCRMLGGYRVIVGIWHDGSGGEIYIYQGNKKLFLAGFSEILLSWSKDDFIEMLNRLLPRELNCAIKLPEYDYSDGEL